MRAVDVFFRMYVCMYHLSLSVRTSPSTAACCACVCRLLRLTLKAHIYRSNGAMGLKICMYSNPPMGGRQPNFQKKISAQKKVLSYYPRIL